MRNWLQQYSHQTLFDYHTTAFKATKVCFQKNHRKTAKHPHMCGIQVLEAHVSAPSLTYSSVLSLPSIKQPSFPLSHPQHHNRHLNTSYLFYTIIPPTFCINPSPRLLPKKTYRIIDSSPSKNLFKDYGQYTHDIITVKEGHHPSSNFAGFGFFFFFYAMWFLVMGEIIEPIGASMMRF